VWERACAAAHLEAADLDAKLLSKLILQRLHLRAVVVALALEPRGILLAHVHGQSLATQFNTQPD
jgi:hypothetical protein